MRRKRNCVFSLSSHFPCCPGITQGRNWFFHCWRSSSGGCQSPLRCEMCCQALVSPGLSRKQRMNVWGHWSICLHTPASLGAAPLGHTHFRMPCWTGAQHPWLPIEKQMLFQKKKGKLGTLGSLGRFLLQVLSPLLKMREKIGINVGILFKWWKEIELNVIYPVPSLWCNLGPGAGLE